MLSGEYTFLTAQVVDVAGEQLSLLNPRAQPVCAPQGTAYGHIFLKNAMKSIISRKNYFLLSSQKDPAMP
jgi:hypothetical protein